MLVNLIGVIFAPVDLEDKIVQYDPFYLPRMKQIRFCTISPQGDNGKGNNIKITHFHLQYYVVFLSTFCLPDNFLLLLENRHFAPPCPLC